MAKEYKDATPAEKYKSAMDKEKADKNYSVTDALKKLITPKETATPVPPTPPAGLPEGKKKGGKVDCECKKMASGGYVRAADGCAQRGKTRGKMV